MILDEVYKVLISSEFRPKMAKLPGLIQYVLPRQIFMTGTLPPSLVDKFKQKMNLDPRTPVVLFLSVLITAVSSNIQ